ncbi:hypothetical protein XELAEV_18039456mg [Xenopus laevis]|uniref:acylphosphatase n=1 Tax=Xenopus laevis TaxID=8355 RepID=A0A974C8X6_XENLA|nr:hypothetical protein XELAEV_18039456mg [Xenopus laevis]
MAEEEQTISVKYEVFGKAEENRLGLYGWVQNRYRDSCKDQMQVWLQKKGSPMSRITKVQFQNERIQKLEHSTFSICK